MKQIGNLASVCARKQNVLFQVLDGRIIIQILGEAQSGGGPDKEVLSTAWDDDKKISEIILELNFGKYSDKVS